MPGRNREREREREREAEEAEEAEEAGLCCVFHRRPAHDWPEEAEAGSVATSQPIDQ